MQYEGINTVYIQPFCLVENSLSLYFSSICCTCGLRSGSARTAEICNQPLVITIVLKRFIVDAAGPKKLTHQIDLGHDR